MQPGRFITFEGGEGAGKSTQVQLLRQRLLQLGKPVLLTREPGGSPGAESIRALLVSGDVDRWDGHTEALLHSAARRDHMVKTVWPALAAGQWVICDRFMDSTMAYQGYGHGLDKQIVADLTHITLGDFRPHLTIILDLPVETGLARAGARGGGEDRYERMGLAFHQRLRDGFLTIAAQDPQRCAVIAADAPPDQVHQRIWDDVSARLGLPA